MRALFVGRFQPFHLGHLKAIDYVLRVVDELVIGVGSSQEKNTLMNPFSFGERADMINHSLGDYCGKYVVKPIPDFGDDKRWVEYLIKNLGPFEVVYTNAPREKKIFRKARLQVRNVPLFERTKYNATGIRRKMSSGGDWGCLLPKGAVEVVKRVDGVRRMVKLTTS